jgi:hypothetical protein
MSEQREGKPCPLIDMKPCPLDTDKCVAYNGRRCVHFNIITGIDKYLMWIGLQIQTRLNDLWSVNSIA